MSDFCFPASSMAMDELAIRHGVYVTAAYILVFYVCISWQAVSQKRLLFAYKARGEQFERHYNVKDRPMLGWDRAVGNLLEQAMPFLTVFWLNIGLAALGATNYRRVVVAGWIYVAFRALYPYVWFAGGGGRGGSRTKIVLSTLAMYGVIIYLWGNMIHAVRPR